MREYRLGDTLDDYCIKCKRITNHNIVSLVEEQPVKVRCCSCYNDHEYRHEIAPPTKNELKKAALLEELLGKGGADIDLDSDDEESDEIELDDAAIIDELTLVVPDEPEPEKPAAKPGRKTKTSKG
jgi:hypothetical protein